MKAKPVSPEQKIAVSVSTVTVFINLALSAGKLAAGILAHSGAMVSDALHSASDVVTTFVVMAGISLSGRRSDKEHPYGHERMECVVSVLLSVLLAATGVGIGVAGFRKLIGKDGPIPVPGLLALAAAVLSVLVKEWMYWYTRSAARKIKSGALMADAWHHRSDALSSIGAFAGILGARLGFPVLDPAAGIVICILIEKAALSIFKDSIDKMIDKSGPDELTQQLQGVILMQEGVQGIDDLKTRMFSTKYYADVEIAVDGTLPLTEAHKIAEAVHDAIETACPEVKHCMVHVNPADN